MEIFEYERNTLDFTIVPIWLLATVSIVLGVAAVMVDLKRQSSAEKQKPGAGATHFPLVTFGIVLVILAVSLFNFVASSNAMKQANRDNMEAYLSENYDIDFTDTDIRYLAVIFPEPVVVDGVTYVMINPNSDRQNEYVLGVSGGVAEQVSQK